MKSTLVPGLKHVSVLTVTETMLVPNVSPDFPSFADMPPVFATAMMVGFIEAAAIECLDGHLDEGQHSVGTLVNVSHVAATPVGMKLRAEAEITAVDRRRITFRVAAYDEAGLIGEGVHERAVIDLERFAERMRDKVPL